MKRGSAESEHLRREQDHAVLKPFANELAAQIGGSLEVARALLRTGLLGSGVTAQAGVEPAAAEGRVGIWQRRGLGSDQPFERSKEFGDEWALWAQVPRIEPKRRRWRVVYCGESAARGVLYDPYYAPATVLQGLLEHCLGKGEVDVVDLARTNMGIEIRELAISAAALEPDAVVIFAGNNWFARSAAETLGEDCAQAILKQQGVQGLKGRLEREVESRARELVASVCGFYAARNVSVVWVVPEANLLDWHIWKSSVPPLGDAESAEWLAVGERVRRGLERGDAESALSLAQRLITLDGGICGHSLGLLGSCLHSVGRLRDAYRVLEQARDGEIWDRSDIPTPRAYSMTQGALRSAQNCGGVIVDLPRLFGEYGDGKVPGRSLFLDYCHLTDEGIRVAMAAVAGTVAQQLSGAHFAWRDLLAGLERPAASVRGEAAFLAAIHNAHWCQPRGIVEYWCLKAVRTSPHMAKIMSAYLDMQTSPAPPLLSGGAQRLSELGNTATQRYMLAAVEPRLDETLLTSIASALDTLEVQASAHLRGRWSASHSVVGGPVNLLTYFYLSATTPPKEALWTIPPGRVAAHMTEHDYFRAYWAETEVCFIGGAACPVQVSVTCRVPGADDVPGEPVTLLLNGERIGDIPAQSRWVSRQFNAPPRMVRGGINRLVLRWPLSSNHSRDTSNATRIIWHSLHNLFRIFGEIHQLTVGDRDAGARTSGKPVPNA